MSLELITDIYAVNKRVHNPSDSGLLMEERYVELKEKKSKKLTFRTSKFNGWKKINYAKEKGRKQESITSS